MIEVTGLTKYYGEHAAIRDLSFSIERGEVIGFLGLNGAGKSTTLKVLGCVLLPTAGTVRIDGLDVIADPHEVRKRIGFLPDTPPLYNEMTVGRYLRFVAELRGVSSADVEARVKEAEEKTALLEHHDQLINALSHGYRQRVGLAQAIVHRPQLLILDEPTSGLDPVQIVEMRQLIRNLRGQHTVLLSSHILSEISQTCDRLLVIQNGEIVAQGTEAELSTKMSSGSSGVSTVEIEVAGDASRATGALRAIQGVTDVESQRINDETSLLRVRTQGEVRPKLIRALVEANVDVLRIDRGGSKLENIFLQLTQEKGAA